MASACPQATRLSASHILFCCVFMLTGRSAAGRAGLLSEALALIDLLVLVHARHYTGFWFSSFSWVVQVGFRMVALEPTQMNMLHSCVIIPALHEHAAELLCVYMHRLVYFHGFVSRPNRVVGVVHLTR